LEQRDIEPAGQFQQRHALTHLAMLYATVTWLVVCPPRKTA
jgi:hypothetical protein